MVKSLKMAIMKEFEMIDPGLMKYFLAPSSAFKRRNLYFSRKIC